MSEAASSPIALVTGSSSGFGLLTTVELARRGMRVIATMRDPARSEQLDAALDEAGVEAEKWQLDVTDAASIRAAAERFERVDVLVNNAGYGIAGAVEDLSMDEIRDQFETNFFGLVAMTQTWVPGMRQRQYGRVINVSSLNGGLGIPFLGAYCASKYAVEGLSESLRLELLPHGVYVTIIAPGTFRTDIFTRNKRTAARATTPESAYRDTLQRAEAWASKRVEASRADPRDVALAIARAATGGRPPLRIAVGVDSLGASFAKRVLPYRLIETALRRLGGTA